MRVNMAIDLRQVMASVLTFSMFIMLGNMIKREHIDPLFELSSSPRLQYGVRKVSKPGNMKLSEMNLGPWNERNDAVKPCWKKPSLIKKEQSNGTIFFSLTHGPEFHASQVANAVVVARHLGATLALPDIKGTKLGDKRNFEEIYDVNRFMTSLNGIVNIDKNPPAELSNGRLPIIKIPDRVSKDFIAKNIVPIFKNERNLRIATFFKSSNKTKEKENKNLNPYQCMATFDSLRLNQDLQQVVDSMTGTIRSLSQKMYGHFVAVDLRIDELEKKGCRENDSSNKLCYNAEEIGKFLKKIGFHPDTTIYLTQRGWHSSLNGLRNVFPNTFTKDGIMPAYERAKFMDPESREYEKLIDFYMCKEGDIFVPAFPSRFYASIVGERIALGKTQVLVPAEKSSASADDYISDYIAKKSHSAHSCFC